MLKVLVDTDGAIRFVYADDLRGLLQEGNASIVRASHVEPTIDGRWTADLTPVSGPIMGPFDTRKEAIDREVEWLNDHVIA